jgi:hypothetical protein
MDDKVTRDKLVKDAKVLLVPDFLNSPAHQVFVLF